MTLLFWGEQLQNLKGKIPRNKFDCMVLCYAQKEGADQCYDSISQAENPPKAIHLVEGHLLTGVPYSYGVWILFRREHGRDIDDWLVEVDTPSAPDFYSGMARANEFIYYLDHNLVDIIRHESKGAMEVLQLYP